MPASGETTTVKAVKLMGTDVDNEFANDWK